MRFFMGNRLCDNLSIRETAVLLNPEKCVDLDFSDFEISNRDDRNLEGLLVAILSLVPFFRDPDKVLWICLVFPKRFIWLTQINDFD